MTPDIIIPTMRSEIEVAPMVCEMQGYALDCNVIITSLQASAPINRNAGLSQAKSTIVIMVDDDMAGWYPDWWRDLISPLLDKDVVFVSARLMNLEGQPGAMMFGSKDLSHPLEVVPAAPTAACAFRNDGTRFDEAYLGSGFEDTDFIRQLLKAKPKGKVVINNECRLIHLNEQKNQHGKNYEHNLEYYRRKWGSDL